MRSIMLDLVANIETVGQMMNLKFLPEMCAAIFKMLVFDNLGCYRNYVLTCGVMKA